MAAGSLVVAQGTLVASIPKSVSSTPTLEVRSGAILDVSALAGGLTLGAVQKLTGSGTVAGDVSAVSGARIAPGTGGTAGPF